MVLVEIYYKFSPMKFPEPITNDREKMAVN